MNSEHDTSEQSTLAGEYVLGTLQGDARDRFEDDLASDDALQQEVAAWERHLSPMLESVEPVAPPTRVWKAVEARIEARPSQRAGLWNSLAFWRNLSMVAATLALGLGLTLLGLLQAPGELERIMVVTNHQSQTGWIVDTRSRDSMLHVSAVQPTPLPASKVCQLWLVTEDGVLLPIGILPHQGSEKMKLPAALGNDSRFKVSIESALAAPVERPSEEIVFEGQLISI